MFTKKSQFHGRHPIMPISKRAKEKTILGNLNVNEFDEFEIDKEPDDELIDSLKEGWDKDLPRVLVHVSKDGVPKIVDGKHRVAAFRVLEALGYDDNVPTTIYYFGEPRNWLPKSLRP